MLAQVDDCAECMRTRVLAAVVGPHRAAQSTVGSGSSAPKYAWRGLASRQGMAALCMERYAPRLKAERRAEVVYKPPNRGKHRSLYQRPQRYLRGPRRQRLAATESATEAKPKQSY